MFETWEKVVGTILLAIFGPLFLSLPVLLFVYLPTELLAEEKCLENGYPRASVTWNLKRYCTNLDGVVTVRVEQLP